MNFSKKSKINPDKCKTTLDYSCPECGLEDWIWKTSAIGWTEKEKRYSMIVSNKTEPCLVYECPKCFSKIAIHKEMDKIKEELERK